MKTTIAAIFLSFLLSGCYTRINSNVKPDYKDQDNREMLECLEAGITPEVCLCMEDAETDTEVYECTDEEY